MLDAMTPAEADIHYKTELQRLADEHGGFTNIPADLWREVSETTRAWYVVAKYEGQVNKELLSKYMIPLSIVSKIMPFIQIDDTRKVTRADQYKAFEQWAREHDREQFTTEQLVEASGFGYQTTLKFIDGNPYFHKIKKGLYECRDYTTDREQAKKSK
jgi:hypothetical protein